MIFEWDDEKARTNLRKHHVAFEDAVRAFLDPLSVSIFDRLVDGEERWHLLGVVDGMRMLLVVHTFRESGGRETTRIISARRAERWERRHYDQR